MKKGWQVRWDVQVSARLDGAPIAFVKIEIRRLTAFKLLDGAPNAFVKIEIRRQTNALDLRHIIDSLQNWGENQQTLDDIERRYKTDPSSKIFWWTTESLDSRRRPMIQTENSVPRI